MSVTPSDWLRVSDLRWLPEVNVEAAGGLLEDSQFLDVGKREGEWQGDKWNRPGRDTAAKQAPWLFLGAESPLL